MPLPPPQPLFRLAERATTAATAPYFRRRRTLVVARIARRQRQYLRTQLYTKLVADGFQLTDGPRRVSSSEVSRLLETFRVEVRAPSEHVLAPSNSVRGAALIDHLAERQSMAYFVDAPSGEGKTTFALALALHRHRPKLRVLTGRTPLTVLYLDVAHQRFATRLQRWIDELDDNAQAASRRIHPPLILLDGVNETYSIENVAAVLEDHLSSLRQHRARMVFLFSHRHRSYVGKLIHALTEAGLEEPRELRLTSLTPGRAADDEIEAGFFPDDVRRALSRYSAAHPEWPLTRSEAAALMRWVRTHPAADLTTAPPPAVLVAEQFFAADAALDHHAIRHLATAAFAMLGGDETSSRLFTQLDKYLDYAPKARLEYAKPALHGTPLGDIVGVHADGVHIDGEQAIRVLAAVHLAHRLRVEDPPTRLSGSTAYDVAAAYVPWALRRLMPSAQVDELIEQGIRRELTRTDRPAGELVPYSFYGRLLLSSDAPRTSPKLKAALFRSLIDTIDRDRGLTCAEGIAAAGQLERVPHADPVLDQMFELVACTSSSAVAALLDVIDQAGDASDPALVRSQVAYMLVAWLRRLPRAAPLTNEENVVIATIARRLHAGDPNLHLRFHQAQIVEDALVRVDVAGRQIVLAAADAVAAASPDAPGPDALYADLQHAVTHRLRWLIRGSGHPPGAWRGGSQIMLPIIARVSALKAPDAVSLNRFLECWEVTLGLCASAFPEAGRPELREFIVNGLGHPLWIVRWWAYTGLKEIFEGAASESKRSGDVAQLGGLLVDRLVATGEPVGLKQQQCATIEQLLASEHHGAVSLLRRELAGRRHEVNSAEFSRPYGKHLDGRTESYLYDFRARVRRLPVHDA